jgi:hypothetical protein
MIFQSLNSGWAGLASLGGQVEDWQGEVALEAGDPIESEGRPEGALHEVGAIDELAEVELLAVQVALNVVIYIEVDIVIWLGLGLEVQAEGRAQQDEQ